MTFKIIPALFIALITFIPGENATSDDGYFTPDHYADRKLVWLDEFMGNHLNEADWNYELGGSGWGNHELEFYRKENTTVKGGFLIITAKKEDAGENKYTSSRLTTQNKHSFKYGRVDVRARLPRGQGIWPAFWMLGNTITTDGWPKCGEIDMMEMIGGPGKDNTLHGTAHWDENGHASNGGKITLPGASVLGDKFHVYSVIWNETSITWLLDDRAFHTVDINRPGLAELNGAAYLLINLAVGGDWPGSPDATTVFPQQLIVDYVRVFQ